MNWHHVKESWTSGGLPSSERWGTYIARTKKGIFFIRLSDSINPDDIVEIGDGNAVLDHGLFKKGEPSLEGICAAAEGIRGFGKLCKMINAQLLLH